MLVVARLQVANGPQHMSGGTYPSVLPMVPWAYRDKSARGDPPTHQHGGPLLLQVARRTHCDTPACGTHRHISIWDPLLLQVAPRTSQHVSTWEPPILHMASWAHRDNSARHCWLGQSVGPMIVWWGLPKHIWRTINNAERTLFYDEFSCCFVMVFLISS